MFVFRKRDLIFRTEHGIKFLKWLTVAQYENSNQQYKNKTVSRHLYLVCWRETSFLPQLLDPVDHLPGNSLVKHRLQSEKTLFSQLLQTESGQF